MKISLNTLRFYQNEYKWSGDPAPDGIDMLVQKIGAQLGAVEEVIELGEKYRGVVIVKIVRCDPHPNADRLKVCTIDDAGVTPNVARDEHGYVQVVCGAPNVREGLTVAWLPPGSIVPDTFDKEPFKLEARELRGVVSNGMLASAKELAVSDDHDGILEIEDAIAPGTHFAIALNLENEQIIDIENKMFTHRPDCFGWMGVAREIAGIQGQKFMSPDWYKSDVKPVDATEVTLPLQLTNEVPELVQRFVLLPMRDVVVKQSPLWLQMSLTRVGLRPINNIVDLTNYYMLLTGQPLHAYDYDKVKAQSEGDATIVVRHPNKGEKLQLLNGKEITPRPESVVIATDKALIGLGGVMGGADTEVDANTRNIILECGNFDMYSIRRTSMTHGLFTDAVTRFNKGQSPLQNTAVIAKIAADVESLAGGKVAGLLLDNNRLEPEVLERNSLYPAVRTNAAFINERLGLNLSMENIMTLLTNVEFAVQIADTDLVITAPFWRTDIEIPEDIVEEVGRLRGYDHLPLELPKRSVSPTVKDVLLDTKARIRTTLAGAGANELLTYSFVHGDLLQKAGQKPGQAYTLSNALSPDLQYYRQSLTPSLLEKVHPNIKAGFESFALFELGKAHVLDKLDEDGLPAEFERIAFVLAADEKAAKQFPGAAYYQARKYLMHLLSAFGLASWTSFEPINNEETDSATPYYALNRAATVRVGDAIIGRIGEYTPSVRKALKLPVYSAGFELGIGIFEQAGEPNKYIPLPRYPKIEQDMTLRISVEFSHHEVFDFVSKELSTIQPPHTLRRMKVIDRYQSSDSHGQVNITFRLELTSYEKTLRDHEVSKLLDDVAVLAKEKFGAERM